MYFYQGNDVTLIYDEGNKIRKKHAALSRKLKYSDYIYKYIYFFEKVKYLILFAPLRFIYLS